MRTKLKIIGCGGHAKVVIDALSCNQANYDITLCDDNPLLLGKEFRELLVDSTLKDLSSFTDLIHVAIGDNQIRENILTLSKQNNLNSLTITHKAAVISKSAQLKDGSFIAARAILGPDCLIGAGCIINHGAVVDHDVQIGNYAHIAPNSTLGGGVIIGDGVLIGAGAVVLPKVIIGNKAIIGAGAVVVGNVESGAVVKGIPAV